MATSAIEMRAAGRELKKMRDTRAPTSMIAEAQIRSSRDLPVIDTSCRRGRDHGSGALPNVQKAATGAAYRGESGTIGPSVCWGSPLLG